MLPVRNAWEQDYTHTCGGNINTTIVAVAQPGSLWLALYAKHSSLSGSSEPLDPPTKGPVLAPDTRSGLQLCLTIKTLSPLNMCRKSSDFIKLNISRTGLNVLESSHGLETLII